MSETLKGMKRTCYAGEVTAEQVGSAVTVMGWCHRQRDIGGLVFITLRDRSGELQLVFDETTDPEIMEKARQIRSEYVIACRGTLRERQAVNPEMKTGKWELQVADLRILSRAKTTPFYIEEAIDARESLRLEYRYLDLRRPDMQRKLIKRHQIVKATRDFFDQAGFIDIETPTMVLSTPEGARDYLVPSRVFPGSFFALPQSPQLYKQLLMLAGYDRYMQVARCYRDEDLRADRQPEFTQIDLEMSFVEPDDVMTLLEQYLVYLFDRIEGFTVKTPLRRITYAEAMKRYGSDKPDTRFGMELIDVSDLADACDFRVFSGAIAEGGSVQLINVPQGGSLTRKEIDSLTEFVRTYRAKGLAWLVPGEDVRGSFLKFVTPEWIAQVKSRAQANDGDLLLFVADQTNVVLDALGHLRVEVAKRCNLIDETIWDLLWVTEFPMFEYDEEDKRLVAKHHPFTSPMDEDAALLEQEPLKCRAKAYDVILNGVELGGGSIRIHDQAMQTKIFDLIGLDDEEKYRRFGFLLKAFEYGVPPHGGLALGLDRLVMLLTKADNIREVIAFPKVQNSSCLMVKAPAEVDSAQLSELGLEIKKTNEQ